MTKIIESSNFVPPKAIGVVYSKDIRNMVNAMIKDYKSILTIYKDKKDQITMDAKESTWLTTDIQDRLELLGKKWEEKFKIFAEAKSAQVVKRVLKATDTQLKQVLIKFFAQERLELIGKVIPTPLRQVMKAHIIENVSLIKSIQSQYHERIVGAVTRSITGTGSIKSLAMEISKYNREGLNRANLIALDQTRKMYSTMNLRRFEQVGITKVKWLHTHAGKTVRPYHHRKWDGDYSNYPNVNGLNGLIFDISNPPVIQEAKGKQKEIRGYPAELPFCTCVMRAIFE